MSSPWPPEVQGNFTVYFGEAEILQDLFLSDSHKTNLFLFPSTLLSLLNT